MKAFLFGQVKFMLECLCGDGNGGILIQLTLVTPLGLPTRGEAQDRYDFRLMSNLFFFEEVVSPLEGRLRGVIRTI
jgi:hypothetical protein